MFNSIRLKLTLWYVCVLAVMIAVFAFVTYSLFAKVLRDGTSANIKEVSENVIAAVKSEQGDEDRSRPPEDVIADALSEFRFRDYKVAIFSRDNKPVTVTADLELPPEFPTVMGRETFGDIDLQTVPFRFYRQGFWIKDHNYSLFVFHSLADEIGLLDSMRHILLLVAPLLIVIAGIGGYFLARKSLRPIGGMADQAARISAASLHQRLPVKNSRDELGNLAIVINELLDRLDIEFDRQRRFMADASHELRTPLAIVLGESEVALLQKSRPEAEYRESLRVVNDEGKRLTEIVEDLFTLARADSGELRAELRDVYADEVLIDCVRAIRSLAERMFIAIDVRSSELLVKADESLLRRVFINLLGNAIKYNYSGGHISVEVRGRSVRIGNTGPEISAEMAGQIFERFFRADKARTSDNAQVGGAGLGLSIAKVIVNLHKADLRYERVGIENVFSIAFPD